MSAIAAVANELNKAYDCKLVQKMGKKVVGRLPSISLNLPTFDEDVIGCGGFAKGRIYEIYGPESAGKTAICLHTIAETQKAGGNAAFIDAEHALMLSHAKTIGVNVDDLVISQPDYGEQALEVAIALAESRGVDLIIVDSVSALVPKAELEGDMGDSHMGLQARLMSQGMRKLCGVTSKTGTIVIFINQVREKIGVMFGNPETTTGGRALKFFASARFEVRRLSKTDGGEIIDPETKLHLGHRMRIKNIKNKVGNPYRETVVDLLYNSGFDKRADMVQYAVDHDLVTKDGTRWVFDGEKYYKSALTEGEVYDKIALAAKKVIDDKIKSMA